MNLQRKRGENATVCRTAGRSRIGVEARIGVEE